MDKAVGELNTSQIAATMNTSVQVVLAEARAGTRLRATFRNGKWWATPDAVETCRRTLAAESGKIIDMPGGYTPWRAFILATVARHAAVEAIKDDLAMAAKADDRGRYMALDSLLGHYRAISAEWDSQVGKWILSGISPLAALAAESLSLDTKES